MLRHDAAKRSELKLEVELRRDEIALVVNVDGLKLAAETCVAVCEALLELKTAVDAHPDGISSCASMMPGKFTYAELLSCIDQSKRMVAESAKA